MTQKTLFVKDLVPGQPAADIFCLGSARLGQAKNGPFWTLTLEDVTGQIEAKIWSPAAQAYGDLAAGQFALVEGQVGTYRDRPQLNIDRLRVLGPEEFAPDLSQFVASSAEPPEGLLEKLDELCRAEISHAPWRKFCAKVLSHPEFRDRLLEAPGAKSVHHSYRGGLLEHTLSVCELVLSICARYPALDRDTLLAAAMCHDLGKAWELTAGPARDYTDVGRLLGHIVITLELVEPLLKKSSVEPELALHFKHILVAHHGEYEFGSPRRPKTAEAFVLHFADNIDAKMNQIFGSFESDTPGEWSPYVRTLERYLYNPQRAPRETTEKPQKPKEKEAQCLLPLKA
ncbi:MAG: 3'-5' exoribonuclease YhaM family protein [Solidesulfovibrio sp.]